MWTTEMRDRFLLRVMNYSTYVALGGMQVFCGYHWYYQLDKMDDFGCKLFQCAAIDFMIVWAHLKASYSDPGFILRKAVGDEEACKKCGAARIDQQAHHCSKCERCVEMMDHHCFWTDNCVARKTFKPFVLFCIYVIICCIYGISNQIHFYYTVNQQLGLGVQGLWDWLTVPLTVWDFGWLWIGVKDWRKIKEFFLLQVSLMYFGLACGMLVSIVFNLKKNTSMVDQKKMKKSDSVRSWTETFECIFGHPLTLSQMLFILVPINQK